LFKTGVGKQTLSGVNGYTGTTNVNAGTLEISGSGSINSTSSLTVAAGGTLLYNSSVDLTVAPTLNGGASRAVLGGTGTINAAISLNHLNDVLSPGNSPGILPFGTSQTWASYSYDWEINDWIGGVAGTDFDQIAITGSLDLTGTSYGLNLLSLDAVDASGDVFNFAETTQSWTILTTTTGITGFDSLEWAIDASGFTNIELGTWSLDLGNSDQDLVLTYTAPSSATIPEPTTLGLAALGLISLGMTRRRRRRNRG